VPNPFNVLELGELSMSLTHKQRMLAVLRGERLEAIPWAPRLDLWFRANQRRATLPPKYRDASLRELVDDLGWGFHAVVPDFQDVRSPDDTIDRALGIYNLDCMPYRTILKDVERRARIEGDRTIVEYETPKGALRTVALFDESMREAGITISHVEECAFKTEADYAALGWIFEHAAVEPNYEGYRRFAASVGERGLAVGFVSAAGSPMHLIQRELMPWELCCYEQVDRPERVQALAEKIDEYWARVLKVVADSPAEVFFVGGNFDATLTSPPFFRQHVVPWLKKFSDALHARGKFLLNHTDGENMGLLDLYLQTGLDIADSVCPKPMTKLSLKEVRDAFAGRITIMGGVPSVALLPNSVPDFTAFLDDFFAQLGRGDRQILGISDTTPPDADFGRLLEIGRRVRDFGP
jgi:hypothetical protein